MAGRRQLPPTEDLVTMRNSGLTLQQIADQVYDDTGERVTKQAVSWALTHAGHTTEVTRYDDLIPWRVQMRHQKNWMLRMLRMEGRRRRGMSLTPQQEERLDAFIGELQEKDAVVFYNPHYDEGFGAAPRRPGIDTDLVRVPTDALVSQGSARS